MYLTSEKVLEVARNNQAAFNEASKFAPMNGFCLNIPATARVARPNTDDGENLLSAWTLALQKHIVGSGWPSLGGGGLENIGGIDGVHILLVQSHEGFVSFFPSYGNGGGEGGSFEGLRVAGGFLVSGEVDGEGVVGGLKVRLEGVVGERRLFRFLNPFGESGKMGVELRVIESKQRVSGLKEKAEKNEDGGEVSVLEVELVAGVNYEVVHVR